MITMNQSLFQQHVKEGDKPVLVEFWAPWCSYCRRIAPAMQKISEQYEGTLVTAQVNIDDEPLLTQNEQIEVIPTGVHGKICCACVLQTEGRKHG